MKDIYAVLRSKEADLARLKIEVESLRLVVPLLADELNANEIANRDKGKVNLHGHLRDEAPGTLER